MNKHTIYEYQSSQVFVYSTDDLRSGNNSPDRLVSKHCLNLKFLKPSPIKIQKYQFEYGEKYGA